MWIWLESAFALVRECFDDGVPLRRENEALGRVGQDDLPDGAFMRDEARAPVGKE